MKFILEDAEMDAQLQRTAAATYSGSADLGEALAAARRVKPGDAGSWFDEWSALAERTAQSAHVSAHQGDGVTAAKAYLRATEYWRQAIFFVRDNLEDERLQRGWRAHRAAFREALKLLPWDNTIAEIPLAGARMTAYLLRPQADAALRPTVLLPCGFDSTAESGYAATAYMALARGYNALLWDGPGQGGMLYEQRIPMRPDFEAVLTPVIDWLVSQPGVSPEGLVLMGRSFAGYLAPRAAATEPRLAALVCDPGQVEFVSRIVPKMFSEEEWARIGSADPEIDRVLQQQLDNPRQRGFFAPRMTTFGTSSVGEFLRMQKLFSAEEAASKIKCPTLVTEGEGDFASQSVKLFELLTCEKRLHRFTDAEGAGGHCSGLGATLWEGVVFDWLAEVLARRGFNPSRSN